MKSAENLLIFYFAIMSKALTLQKLFYSFPMKYHPLLGEFSHNRNYIGKHWNRKYIRSIQAILNSTKGSIGRGLSYFYKAFGTNKNEFHFLLDMLDTYIIYRYFF
ncbi:hypothetical protein [uncultured Alistipes sp.]|nr:hypothetical protein [uncultured Alistipes sp.]